MFIIWLYIHTQIKKLTDIDGFKLVHHASGSEDRAYRSTGKMNLFTEKYNVEDKPFYNHSGSFYLSFLMKGDESINGSDRDSNAFESTSELAWENYNQNYIPKLPESAHHKTVLINPPVRSGSWQRYVVVASQSYWAPQRDPGIVGAPGGITDFGVTGQYNVLHGDDILGNYPIIAGGRYSNLATYVTASGIPFTGSISPAGDLFRIYVNTDYNDVSACLSGSLETGTVFSGSDYAICISEGGTDITTHHAGAITSSYLTDIKITKYDPREALPFSETYRTGSTEFTTWYNDQHDSASFYDDNNIHSLMKTLPSYLDNDNEMDNTQLRSFVNLMGENFDLIKNYIDNYATIFKVQYGEVGSLPNNLLPIVANNYNWNFSTPLNKGDSTLLNFMGSSMADLNSTENTKNNIWRNIINNVQYIYKRKGTVEGIRALLNSYGFPPDIMKIKEHGASMDDASVLSGDVAPSTTGLDGETGNTSYTKKVDNLISYIIDSGSRKIRSDWRLNDVNASGIEFAFESKKGTQEQTILKSSGSASEDLWDLILEPSKSIAGTDNFRSKLSFRINNEVNDASIHTNCISMSSDYYNFKNQNFWNVLIQRTSGPTGSSYTGDIGDSELLTSHSYEMYIGELKEDKIRALQVVSMSYGGEDYSHSAANFIGTGSRTYNDTGNLVIGEIMTGSIAEVRTWKYPLSASVFKQHIYDKKSAVGNSLTDSQTNIIYRFKLNENWQSGSSDPIIKDSNPKNVKDYSMNISQSVLGDTPLYDTNVYERIMFSAGGNAGLCCK